MIKRVTRQDNSILNKIKVKPIIKKIKKIKSKFQKNINKPKINKEKLKKSV